jgi:hypothetical protein
MLKRSIHQRLVLVPLVVLAAMATATPALAVDGAPLRGGKVFLPSRCYNKSYEPRRVVVSCADFASRVRGLNWGVWSRGRAVGRGTLLYKDCVPTYSCHHYDSVRARLVASRPRYCRNVHRNSFTRLRVNALGPKPGLKHYTLRYPCFTLHR